MIIASSCEDLAKIFFELNYNVFVICKNNSLNLAKYCKNFICVNFHDKSKINNFINKIDNKENLEILIGSGFSESLTLEPFLTNKRDRGNKIQLHQRVKSQRFFQELKKKKINIPKWSLTKPLSKNCLVKDFKSFGGYMIKNYLLGQKLKESEYFQQEIKGEHISVQFFFENMKIRILSICNQFFKKDNFNPFIIETIISKKVDYKIFDQIVKICTRIASLYELNGINNLDLILETKTKKIFVIELNARPGLSTNIIYRIHKNIFKNEFLKISSINPKFFFGTKVVYSNKKIIIEKKKFKFIKSLENSSSYSELPINKQIIKINEPICLIHKKSKKNQILREKLEKMSYKIIRNLN